MFRGARNFEGHDARQETEESDPTIFTQAQHGNATLSEMPSPVPPAAPHQIGSYRNNDYATVGRSSTREHPPRYSILQNQGQICSSAFQTHPAGASHASADRGLRGDSFGGFSAAAPFDLNRVHPPPQ